jgi:uncharacterized phiE125 gp8 family phage protein
MAAVRTQDPAVEPISLDDAKNHMRVDPDMTDDDALIGLLITSARLYAESQTGRSFITQKWRLVMDCFPQFVQFEFGPVQSVDSIVYTDMAGVQQTITAPAAPNYAIDLSGVLPRMTPGFGRIWPIPLPQIGSVQVNYTAGYGATPADVPAGIRQWLLLRVGTLYENREEVAILTRGKVEPLPYVDALLDPYRLVLA